MPDIAFHAWFHARGLLCLLMFSSRLPPSARLRAAGLRLCRCAAAASCRAKFAATPPPLSCQFDAFSSLAEGIFPPLFDARRLQDVREEAPRFRHHPHTPHANTPLAQSRRQIFFHAAVVIDSRRPRLLPSRRHAAMPCPFIDWIFIFS